MNQQAQGLRRFLLIMRRPWDAVSIFALLGLLAGVTFAQDHPMFTGQALVDVVAPVSPAPAPGGPEPAGIKPVMAGQMLIAGSIPVLQRALHKAGLSMSLQTLQGRVQITGVAGSSVLSISAVGTTAAQAKGTANAVANSYVVIVDSPNGRVQARVLDPATMASGPSLSSRVPLPLAGCLGALLGALIGAIGTMVFRRRGRPLLRI